MKKNNLEKAYGESQRNTNRNESGRGLNQPTAHERELLKVLGSNWRLQNALGLGEGHRDSKDCWMLYNRQSDFLKFMLVHIYATPSLRILTARGTRSTCRSYCFDIMLPFSRIYVQP